MNKVYHESSSLHVSGKAEFIDDMPEGNDALYGVVYYSNKAHAEIVDYNLDYAKAVEGVVCILSYKDIPGENQLGAVVKDEPILANGKVECIGQAIFLIAASSKESAYEARKKIEVKYNELPIVLTIDDAIEAKQQFGKSRCIHCGNVEQAIIESQYSIEGTFCTGAQEHWYLETQISLCIPVDDGGFRIHSSNQNPTEAQLLVAEALKLPLNKVEVVVKRMGGAFGGKETQGNHQAVWAALLSYNCGRKVKMRLSRQDDQIMTGKRHPFRINYRAGYNSNGLLAAVDLELNSNGGYATDLSLAILERAMFHSENAYFVPNMRIVGRAWKTNLPSNVAFRGFGAPQAMAAIEQILDRIAFALRVDAATIRRLNFYKKEKCNISPYGQLIENNPLHEMYDHIITSSDYFKRKKDIETFNNQQKYKKKGIALTPVKFGISFTTTYLNQAGALVNIYTDGSVLVNHGGTEMGQGLHTKMQKIVADELGISLNLIKIAATNTSVVPNTSPTAASSGSDLNGQAVRNAILVLKQRMIDYFCLALNVTDVEKKQVLKNLIFQNNRIIDSTNGTRSMSIQQLVQQMRMERISLSANGFYTTPDIFYDREKEIGKPFFYFVFGISVSEVLVDLLSGEAQLLRVDIVQDTGESIVKEIDTGQIEGGFIQGMGWCTTENCIYNKLGKLLNDSPATYKIPGIANIPIDMKIDTRLSIADPKIIKGSKAVGEPPFMLALSVWFAIKNAVAAAKNHIVEVDLAFPATNEAIIIAVNKLKTKET